MVLRAEITCAERQIVTHTTALGEDSVCVRTDEPLGVGDSVDLKLSFRPLLAPIQLTAQVVAKDEGAGHGYWPGVTLAFAASAEQENVLRHLLGAYSGSDLGTYRILVVEDSAFTRDFVQVGAERFSASGSMRLVVETTDSAEAALALLRERTFDLALIDLYLGGELDGADLVRSMRAQDPDIALVGFSIGKAAARDRFLAAGADLFLDKPVTVKDLFATIERLTMTRSAP